MASSTLARWELPRRASAASAFAQMHSTRRREAFTAGGYDPERATAVPLPTLYEIRLRWGYRLVQLTKRSSRSTKRSNTLKARSSGSGWVMSTPVIFSASSGYIALPVLRKSR